MLQHENPMTLSFVPVRFDPAKDIVEYVLTTRIAQKKSSSIQIIPANRIEDICAVI